jgi:hypothetical protein
MFVARGAQWSGPEINSGTMAAPGAMINAKKTRRQACREPFHAGTPTRQGPPCHPDRGLLLRRKFPIVANV